MIDYAQVKVTDYAQLKVPELKKILTDRALPISGNKADLIARLQEHDKKSATTTAGPSAPAADDEIDWDEDDAKATAPSATTVVSGSRGQTSKSAAVRNQKSDAEPAKAKETKAVDAKNAPKVPDTVTSSDATASAPVSAPAPAPVTDEAPKKDFSLGIQKTDAEKEAERRAARAKRFGIPDGDEEQKKLDRAKKFGVDSTMVVKGLDDALPEGRAKRVREAGDKGERSAKRQAPDRRTRAPAKGAAGPAKKPAKQPAREPVRRANKRIIDDPVEKAKAEARAKRFQTAA